MKKQLLYLLLPVLCFATTVNAQDILYWDFGGRDLGEGYKNMLPVDYLNGWAATNAYGIGPEAYGSSVEYLNAHPQWSVKWNNTGFHYGINVNQTEDEGGFLMSGGSSYTKPEAMLPLLDTEVNLIHRFSSNNDRLYSVRRDVTRYDERDEMPDGDAAFASHFPGAVEFTSSGFDRPDRGFILTGVTAGQTVTIVGRGVYGWVNDAETEEETGTFTFENVGLFGDGQYETNQGAGPDDESVRVIKFTATADGDFNLGYADGKIRIYRIYLGDVDVDVTPDEALIRVYDFGGEQLDTAMYDNMLNATNLNAALSAGAGAGIIGEDLSENSIPYDLAIDDGSTRNPVGLGENYHGNQFPRDVWFIHNSVGTDRWRTSNTELIGYDDNVGGPAEDVGLSGRIYINTNGPRDRYFSIRPEVDNQEVTILFRGENVGTPSTINVEGLDWTRTFVGGDKGWEFTDSNVKALRFTLPTAGVDYQIWDDTGKLSVYRIYMANVPFDAITGADNLGDANLSVADLTPYNGTQVRAIGNRIYLSNVTSKTDVNIYSITGQLVKTMEVSRDMDFEFRTGVYIATVKSAEGQKSVKLITY